MNKGFMRLHRQLLDWEWFDNSQMVHLWIYFLLKANYQNSKWHGVDVPRGSFITSLDSICKDTGLTVQNVRTCISKLKSTNEITIKVTNRYSIITLCKYDMYNTYEPDDNKQTNTQDNKQLTSNQQATNKQLTTDKEIEELKKENERLKKELANASKKKGELDLSIVDPEYLDVVNLWLKYKKERGETYKPTGFEQMYKKLIKLSGNNPLKAKKIVEESMSNNYSGFFPLKVDSLPLGFIQKDEGDDKYEKAETW